MRSLSANVTPSTIFGAAERLTLAVVAARAAVKIEEDKLRGLVHVVCPSPLS
jgi:hypothetical protein